MRSEHLEIEGVPMRAELTPGGPVGLLALHGSNEGGTAELARLVAESTGATCLTFTQPDGPAVHVPSPRMAAPHCALLREFLTHVEVTVSLHGHLRPSAPRSLFLGGANRAAAHTLAAELDALRPEFTPVTDLDAIPRALRGLHPRNPVNLTRATGVQVELPLAARTVHPNGWEGPDLPPTAVTDALTAGVRLLAEGPRRPPGR
ncbi:MULTISPECIES: poly-gamma-glutamate hydrolase family protein [unclassified Streptomyces]|uniref:poly-gamma-glutamate hydrolase family protein n=1 Tax=unclassified Streptomyces TaxID=2593676 RepID=UPI0038153F95